MIFQRAPVLGPSLCKYVSGTILALYAMNGKIHGSIHRVIKAGKHLQYQSPTIIPAAPCSPLNRAPRYDIHTSSEHFQGWWFHPFSLGSLSQCLNILSVKKFFPLSNLNLPWYNLWTFPFGLSFVTWEIMTMNKMTNYPCYVLCFTL